MPTSKKIDNETVSRKDAARKNSESESPSRIEPREKSGEIRDRHSTNTAGHKDSDRSHGSGRKIADD